MRKDIITFLLAILLFPSFVSAIQVCEIYDDFSSGSLNASKWEIRQDIEGQPLMDEYGVINESGNFIFHTQQNQKQIYLLLF